MPALQKYFIESENISVYEQIFENVTIIDSHAHLGRDVDGHALTAPALVSGMDENEINRAIVFPLNDPRAGKSFSAPNDYVNRSCRKYPDKLIPFFRLDPNHDWSAGFAKRVNQGFRGVKLHPLSQKFRVNSPAAVKLYEKIEANNLMLLVHCGFGVGNLAEDLVAVSRDFKNLKLIIGHGGFGELDSVIKLLGERPNVLFEISAMRFFDLVELLRSVPYRKVVFGSDIPYYDQTLSLQMLVDSATLTKHSPNQIRLMLGGNIEKWLK